MRFSGPNLVPLLDVLFVRRQQEPLELPTARSGSDCTNGWYRCEPITINAHHRDDRACSGRCAIAEHWILTVDGRECTDPLVLRGTIAVESAERQRGPIVNRRVIIRSDAHAPCWLAQRAMNVCAKEGIFKIEVGAAMPPQTR